MIHEHVQPLNKKRNRAYIDQMVKVLSEKFKETKKLKVLSGRQEGGSTRSRVGRLSPSGGGATVKLATKSRPEVSVAKAPVSKAPSNPTD